MLVSVQLSMKIIRSCLLATLLLTLAGCASAPSHGGSSAENMEGVAQMQNMGQDESGDQDYRQTLADPGPF